MAICANGLLRDIGGSGIPALLRPPEDCQTRVAIPLKTGLLVAAQARCYIYSNGTWRELPFEDTATSGIAIPEGAIVIGLQGVYHVSHTGEVRILKKFEGTRMPRAYLFAGEVYIFAGRDGTYKWTGAGLIDAGPEFPWPTTTSVLGMETLPNESQMFATGQGIYVGNGESVEKVLDAPWREYMARLVVNASMLGSTLAISTFTDGMFGYDLQSRREVWRIKKEEFGSHIYSVQKVGNALVIGGSDGLFVVTDPSELSQVRLPGKDPRFMESTGDSMLVGVNFGVWDLNSASVVATDFTSSILRVSDGAHIYGGFGKIRRNGTSIEIGGREIHALEQLDNDTIVAAQPHGVCVIEGDRVITRWRQTPTATHLTKTQKGDILLGTPNGAHVYSRTGTLKSSFGTNYTTVHRVGDRGLAFDSTGAVYSDEGTRLTNIPFPKVVSCAASGDEVYCLCESENGSPWIIRMDLRDGLWQPLDIPLPAAPSLLALHRGQLVIAGAGWLLTSKIFPPLPPPSLEGLQFFANGRVVSGQADALSAHENELEIAAPLGRLPPWKNPTYEIQMEGGETVLTGAGGRVRLPRIPYGDTSIAITARFGGLSKTSHLEIARLAPWWNRWPGIALGSALSALAVYALSKIRNQRLEARARHLQSLVQTKTLDLQKAQKAREEFFSTLSHEIRNPLNGVVGLCQILNRFDGTSDPERQRTLLRTLQGCSDQLRSIIDDVLDFTRIDRGEIQLHSEPFELNTAVEQASRAADAELSRCHIGRTPDAVWVLGDQGKLRQIVTNLVSNALKYGVPTEARIQTHFTHIPDGRVALSISVVNTGPDIPKEELELIFSGFVRGSGATQRRIQGTGLGLAVSRRIAEAMGGKLEVRSENQRTEFQLQLVLPIATPQEQSNAVPTPVHPRRILAVEDEPYNRLVMQHLLSDLGFETDWAADGATALERVRQNKYDMILTDLALPDISGMDLAQQIHSVARTSKLPIVAVTAFCTPERIAQARAAGILHVVTKPVSQPKLAAVLNGCDEGRLGH